MDCCSDCDILWPFFFTLYIYTIGGNGIHDIMQHKLVSHIKKVKPAHDSN